MTSPGSDALQRNGRVNTARLQGSYGAITSFLKSLSKNVPQDQLEPLKKVQQPTSAPAAPTGEPPRQQINTQTR